MPEEAYWETLLDVNGILERLRIGNGLQDVVELGCGYGTFSLPVAASISGVLLAFDIDAAMVTRTRQRAEERGIRNLLCEQRDVFQDGFGVGAGSQDACLLFNILHCEQTGTHPAGSCPCDYRARFRVRHPLASRPRNAAGTVA